MSAPTNNEAPRRQTPTEQRLRLQAQVYDIVLAALTKTPLGRAESAEVKQATMGALADKFVSGSETLREDGETLEAWMQRQLLTSRELLKITLVLNDESYQDELLREALAEIRNPATVTT